RRINVPKPGCCCCEARLAVTRICVPQFPILRSLPARRCDLKSRAAQTFSSFANCSAVFISASREELIQATELQLGTTRCATQSRRLSVSQESHSMPLANVAA